LQSYCTNKKGAIFYTPLCRHKLFYSYLFIDESERGRGRKVWSLHCEHEMTNVHHRVCKLCPLRNIAICEWCGIVNTEWTDLSNTAYSSYMFSNVVCDVTEDRCSMMHAPSMEPFLPTHAM